MWRIVGAALLAAVVFASPARAANGQYTHVLCADPSTGKGVGTNGQLPAGMTLIDNHTVGTDAAVSAVCSGASPSGVLLHDGVQFTTTTAGDGIAALVYRPPNGTTIDHATIYVAGFIGNPANRVSVSVHGGDPPTYFYGPPVAALCAWNSQTPCTGIGDASTSFSAANKVDWTPPTTGFYLTMGCDIPDTTWTCSMGETPFLQLYGGRITLRDSSDPVVSTPTGALATSDKLSATPAVSLSATDTGSGVYMGRILIDGELFQRGVLDANGGLCRDTNPSNGDDYEFASGTPCKSSASGSLSIDTTRIADGVHRLQIEVEDAAGNTTTAIDKTVTVDTANGRIGPGTDLALRGTANGENASDQAKLRIRWSRTKKATLKLGWAHAASIQGVMTDANGAAIKGASLDVATKTTVPGAPLQGAKHPPTTSDTGTFKLTIPKHGKQIVLQARAGHGAWQRFDVVRTNTHGAFHASYRFRTGGAAIYTFRAVSRFEAAYPYIAGNSPGVHVSKG